MAATMARWESGAQRPSWRVRAVRWAAGALWRLTLRVAPLLALAAVVGLTWPAWALSWALRRGLAPRVAQRWPERGAAALAALGVAVVTGVPAALVLAGLAQPGNLAWAVAALLLGSGVVTPAVLASASGRELPAALRGLLAAGTPLVVLWAAVLLAVAWPWVGRATRWSILRFRGVGGDGGESTRNRKSEIGAPVSVVLKPVPTQRIATATFGDDAWTVKPLYGPALLSMVVAPPGIGKTELAYGSLAAAFDGLPFCGLGTAKPRRVLLLSEMEPKTLQPALVRYGFVATAATPGALGVVHRLRLRYLRPGGSPGHLIDVVHASDAYAPDGDGRRPEWADVIRATVPVLRKGKYDLLVVDSLARWMGNDSSNAAMLDALGALRQVTRLGVGVLAPHHCAKDATPPYAPRGGSAILGELDLCWSLAHPEGKVTVEALRDPRRILECVKSRFSEDTPPPLRIERVAVDPDAPRPRYGYRLLTGAAATVAGPVPTPAETRARLTERQAQVLGALAAAPGHRATTPDVTAATGLAGNTIKDVAVALIRLGLVVPDGTGEAPGRGGRAPLRYRVTPLGLELAPVDEPGGQAERLLHEALDA